MVDFGSLGGSRERKGDPSKTLVLLSKTMVFEVRRPRGRTQMQKRSAPKPMQKTSLKIMRFFVILGPKMEPKWIQNRIQNSQKNRSENREARMFKTEVRGGPWEWVGGSGVGPAEGGEVNLRRKEEYAVYAVFAVFLGDPIRPVPRGYGGFNGLTPLPPTHK